MQTCTCEAPEGRKRLVFGMFAGYIINKSSDLKEKIVYLFLLGFSLLLAGDLTSYIFPLNKNLWSTSFTLLVGGISCLAFAFFVFLVDESLFFLSSDFC